MSRADPYRVTVIGLAVLTVVMFAYPCLRIDAEFEIDYNEGWNAFLQGLAVSGVSPYSGGGALFFNNYPPLSFYLVGLLGLAVGDPVLAGRLLSVLAMGVIAVSAGVVTRANGGSRPDAGLAAATCCAMFCAFATDYVGVDDPQLLAQGLLCAGFALYVSGRPTPARMAAVALLFALGLLTKHNVLVLPLVVTVHALWRAPAAGRWTFLTVGLTLIAIATATIAMLFGADFFRLLLAPRIYDATRGFLLTMEVLGRIQAPLAIAGLYLLLARDGAIGGMVAAYLAGSLLLGIGFSGGAGVDINIFFDAMIASAMGIGLTATWLRSRQGLPRSAPAMLAVLANIGVLLLTPQVLGRMVVEALGDYAERETLFRADVDYLGQIPGPAVCESMLLCLRAGKEITIDPYNVLQASLTGRLPPEYLEGMLRRHAFAIVQISSMREHPLDEAKGLQVIPPRFVNFSDGVFDELARSYTVDRVGLTGRFHRPKPP
ncbi:MAG: hypothetical protein Q7R40_04045 [Phaeospirillum sp.]|nr:hypothetical protein [Phaeospirillum sp.]